MNAPLRIEFPTSDKSGLVRLPNFYFYQFRNQPYFKDSRKFNYRENKKLRIQANNEWNFGTDQSKDQFNKQQTDADLRPINREPEAASGITVSVSFITWEWSNDLQITIRWCPSWILISKDLKTDFLWWIRICMISSGFFSWARLIIYFKKIFMKNKKSYKLF